MSKQDASQNQRPSLRRPAWRPLLALLLLVAAALLAWSPLTALLADPETLRATVARMGVWGPVVIVLLGVLQVIIAPLPGYPVVLASGVLFGGFWGAIYANLGILLAGMLAALLARRLGRPLVDRFVSKRQGRRLQRLLAVDSTWAWFVILFLPTGDLPYFAAGLSQVPLRRYFWALVASRLPFTFVLTYGAAGASTLPTEQLLQLAWVALLVVAIAYWQQERFLRPAHRLINRLLPGE